MKVIKIILYSLVVVLITQTFIIGCPTCFKPASAKENRPENQVRGNEGSNVIGEMGTGSSSELIKKNPLIQVIAAQNTPSQGAQQ